MFVCTLTLLAIAFAPVVLAQGFLSGLQGVLNSTGLTSLVNLTSFLNGTAPGQEVLTELSQGSKTFFAPTDAALAAVNPIVLSNSTILADILAYHIVSGNFVNETKSFPNVTIGRTLLNDSTFVQLEGNKSQVLAWSKSENGSLFVQNQGGNVSVTNTTSFEKTEILVIDSVLTPPPNTTAIFNNASYDITGAAAILQSTAISGGPSIFDALINAHGFTAFVPNNPALQAAQSTLSGLSSNVTALQNVLENHIINGTSVYSTSIFPKTAFRSAAGQTYLFVTNSTGLFVSVGGSNTVEVIQRNVLTSNGVIHIVNGVMIDTNANAAAASSAFASATSVAAQTTSAETGPVGGTATTTAAPTATTTAGAVQGVPDWKLGALAGLILGIWPMV